MNVDKKSPIPVYYQILVDLEKRITNLEWHIGEAMPSENELVKNYGVSRVTIRQALEKLAIKGVVVKKRGQGTFVAHTPAPIEQSISFPTEYKESVMHFGIELVAKVIKIDEVIDPVYAKHLELDPDSPLIHIERLFTSNDMPYSLNHSWLPAKLVPEINDNGLIKNSLSRTLRERYGIIPAITDNWIEALITTPEIESLLNVETDSVLMSITTVEKAKNRTPIEYSVTYWRKERIRFHFSDYHAEDINPIIRKS